MNIPSTGVNSDTATRSICEGDNAQFTISGGPVAPNRSYEWILDGNPLALTNTPTLNYSAFTGVQTFEVNVYDRSLQDSVTLNPLACFSATNSITVTSIAAVNPVLTSDAINETFCDGENVIFTATPIAGVTNYRFERNGGIIIYDGPSNTTSNSVFADVDNVKVTLTLASGCTAVTSLTMFKNRIISAGTISPSAQTICSGATPTLLTGTATPSFLGTASVTLSLIHI